MHTKSLVPVAITVAILTVPYSTHPSRTTLVRIETPAGSKVKLIDRLRVMRVSSTLSSKREKAPNQVKNGICRKKVEMARKKTDRPGTRE